MRIIAGAFKSRTILAPEGTGTRPTTDRARETLFNVLNNLVDFEDIRVLDLFAGSGALAFEAISRGASHATLVERDRKATQGAKTNAHALGIEQHVTILPIDVFRFLKKPAEVTAGDVGFDLILTDAPYDEPRSLAELPMLIFENKWLAKDGICAIEHRSNTQLDIPEVARVIRELKAGEAGFTIVSWSKL